MADAVAYLVAVLAVALAFFLRTIVPYLNAHAADGKTTFELRYAVVGFTLFLSSLFAAIQTIDQLPAVISGSLGAIFITYFLAALTTNHFGFEAIDKART